MISPKQRWLKSLFAVSVRKQRSVAQLSIAAQIEEFEKRTQLSAAAADDETPAAINLPEGFVETQIAGGLAGPTAFTQTPDGRFLIAQQGGSLRVFKDGALLATPFVDLQVDSSGERGLLGVAVDPDFETNGYVYLYYTATSPITQNRISRFTALGDVAAPGSEEILFELGPVNGNLHNGGALQFGLDGKLYAVVGDDSSGSNSQSLNSLFGKMLRLNTDGSIPTDNPFFESASGNNRAIWALGLRNSFTFNVQPGTGKIYINDVGQDSFEEINEGVAGGNFGWPNSEGIGGFGIDPVYAYDHGQGCAISGGTFYNPTTAQFPVEYVGDYFFQDFCHFLQIYMVGPSEPVSPNGIPEHKGNTRFENGVSWIQCHL